jgi:hypothetical protein
VKRKPLRLLALGRHGESGRAMAGSFDGSHIQISNAEDIAEIVLFFASPRSAKSTDNMLNMDGGAVAAYTR